MGRLKISCSKILVRATNWVGDAVMSLPALAALRGAFPGAEIVALARPWVADIYALSTAIDRVIPYHAARGARDLSAKWDLAKSLRAEKFDCAILLQNAFEAAMLARLAGVQRRIGYDRDGRGWLLTDAIVVPKPGEIPRHQRFYPATWNCCAAPASSTRCLRATRSGWMVAPRHVRAAWRASMSWDWSRP